MTDDLGAHARELVAANLYLTLGTVGADGRPWTAPVCFAAAGLREFLWVSEVDAVHSRHLAGRPAVSLVVFDSTVPPFHGRALYAVGEAGEVPDPELDAALATYTKRGISGVTRADLTGSSAYRLYRATATEVWVLCPREPGRPCPRHGLAKDHRAAVPVG